MTDVAVSVAAVPSLEQTVSATTPVAHRASHGVYALVAGDVLSASVAAVVVHLVSGPLHAAFLLALLLCWPALLATAAAYEPRRLGIRIADPARRVVQAGGALGLACWGVSVLTGPPHLGGQLLLLTATVTTTSLGLHVGAAALGRTVHRRGGRVLVAGDVGASKEIDRAVLSLGAVPKRHGEVTTVLIGDEVAGVPGGLADVVTPGALAGHALQLRARSVVVLPGGRLDPAALRRLQWQLEELAIELYVDTGLPDVVPSRTTVTYAAGAALLQVRPARRSNVSRQVGGILERFVALGMLFLLLPVLVGISLAVRRGSPGPAVFRQTRVGCDGAPFTMFKFRTMTTGAELLGADLRELNEADGALFKVRADPRITPLGSVLRRYSLDEVPQLVNVVLGQMSLVGPRPALPHEVEAYEPDAHRRLAVKPGLTGLWQVSGRSDLSWEDTVRLDLHYVDNWTVALDLRILVRTLGAVLLHRGAY